MLKSQKPHIGIFGRRNVGKSSFINALTGQETAIVSEQAGTTTDPVTKTMEITGVGPVVLTDTAGIDDEGELGAKRISRTRDQMDAVDLGIIIICDNCIGEDELSIVDELKRRGTPFFVVHNKSDISPLAGHFARKSCDELKADVIDFSSVSPSNIDELIALVKKHLPASSYQRKSILGDLVSHGDIVVLVAPIDIEAPEGRLILPQVQTIRDLLDNDCVAIVLKERELDAFFKNTKIAPKLVVTDSQAFLKVDASVPRHIPLTSFSILFARLKGDFDLYLAGTPAISRLANGDRVLILESCSHHVAGDDIGRVKIPRWISSFTGKKIEFEVVAGLDRLPKEIGDYSMVIQCGGCMLTRKQMKLRLLPAIEAGVPVTNYGMTIAYCMGIYKRALQPFGIGAADSLEYL